jgi:hypothetical protein
VLDENDGVLALQLAQQFGDHRGLLVAGARQRLVEQQQPRVRRHGDREFELALLAVRQAAGREMGAVVEAEPGECVHRLAVQRVLAGRVAEEAEARAGAGLHGKRGVLQHGEAGEDRGDLERARQPQRTRSGIDNRMMSAPSKRMAPSSLAAIPESWWMSVVLPAPLGPMMACSSPGSTSRRDVVGDPQGAVGLAQILHLKQRLSHGGPGGKRARRSPRCRRG